MSRVYSARLAQWLSPSTDSSESFNVPDGYVWVVRSIDAVNLINWSDGMPSTLGGCSASINGYTVIFNVWAPYALWGWPYHLETRQVLVPGENITLGAADQNWMMTVSGYALQLP